MPATEQIAPVRLNLPDPLPLTITVPEAAQWARLGKNTVWDAVHRGEIAHVRLGGRVLIPTVEFLRLFGVETEA